jgi:hypothetical protein
MCFMTTVDQSPVEHSWELGEYLQAGKKYVLARQRMRIILQG